MKASEIVADIQRITESVVDSTATVLGIINRGQLEIAGGGDRDHGNAKLAPLPDLFTSGTVTLTANASNVAMPATYQRGLSRVTVAGEKLKKYDNLQKLLDAYEGRTGAPEAYHLKGRTLWLLPSPASNTTVTLYFYRYPVDMSIVAYAAGPPIVQAVDTSPDGIPPELHFKLLVNFGCREIYSDIEQGLEGNTPDTLKHDALYQRALTDLERMIGFEEGEAVNVGDEYLTDDNIL